MDQENGWQKKLGAPDGGGVLPAGHPAGRSVGPDDAVPETPDGSPAEPKVVVSTSADIWRDDPDFVTEQAREIARQNGRRLSGDGVVREVLIDVLFPTEVLPCRRCGSVEDLIHIKGSDFTPLCKDPEACNDRRTSHHRDSPSIKAIRQAMQPKLEVGVIVCASGHTHPTLPSAGVCDSMAGRG